MSNPELLAPGGTLEAALWAYKYGADGVYCGLDRFNARQMGQNLSLEELSKLSRYAKDRGLKFYLTLNTLIREQEIQEVGALLGEVRPLRPDGIIIQDLGVLKILKDHYPELPVHGSTQMGFHNSSGLEAARRLGLSRVVLERQVSLEEMKALIPRSPVEVEIFIHGALCCGLSGRCLFSSWIGGHSGNRGRCKQPCRRRYHGGGETKTSGFFFSPQDLYTLDLIPELKALGAAAFKIEGRLKSPDYVAQTVQAYRLMLDAPPGQEGETLKEARGILAVSYGRRWSHGFYLPGETPLLHHDSPGVSGLLIGSAAGVSGGLDLTLSRRLRLGDRIRFQPPSGDEGPAVRVTKIYRRSQEVSSALSGDRVFIPWDRELPPKGLVYKTGEALKAGIPRGDSLPLYVPAAGVRVEVIIDAGGMECRGTLSEPQGSPPAKTLVLRWDAPPQAAENHPLTGEALFELFSATRNPGLKLEELLYSGGGSWFIPPGELKRRRREFWERAAGELKPPPARPFVYAPPPVLREKRPVLVSRLVSSAKTRREEGPTGEVLVFPLVYDSQKNDFSLSPSPETAAGGEGFQKEILLPHFCGEFHLPVLKRALRREWARGFRRFRVTALFQFPLLEELAAGTGAVLTGAYPLPGANSLAAAELGRLAPGLSRLQAWVELSRTDLLALGAASPLPLELFLRGRPFLLATRAEVFIQGPFTDSRGGEFELKKSADGFSRIYGRRGFALPLIRECEGWDLFVEDGETGGGGEKGEPGDFNFSQDWV
ncbi:MAG: U32 family peptidase [Spirochaetales bacterium]|nr:U32 family peptidase [Spirochaetales bacterium]